MTLDSNHTMQYGHSNVFTANDRAKTSLRKNILLLIEDLLDLLYLVCFFFWFKK